MSRWDEKVGCTLREPRHILPPRWNNFITCSRNYSIPALIMIKLTLLLILFLIAGAVQTRYTVPRICTAL